MVVGGTLERLGVRVMMARKLRGLTQEALGRLADVSTSTIRAMELRDERIARRTVHLETIVADASLGMVPRTKAKVERATSATC